MDQPGIGPGIFFNVDLSWKKELERDDLRFNSPSLQLIFLIFLNRDNHQSFN